MKLVFASQIMRYSNSPKFKANEWKPSMWFPDKNIGYLRTKWAEKQIIA